MIDNDIIQIIIDRKNLEGNVNLVGHGDTIFGVEEGNRILSKRNPRPDLSPDEALSDDTRLWAVLQNVSGGTWGGCVYDVDAIINLIKSSEK